MGLYSIYYFFLSEQALLQYNYYLTEPTEKVSLQVWNLFERSPIVNRFAKSTFPSIGFTRKIYIQRHFEELSKITISKLKEDGTLNSLAPDNFYLIRGKKALPADVMIQMIFNKEIFKKNKDGIKVRILHADKLDLMPNMCKTPKKNKPTGLFEEVLNEKSI